MVYFIERFPKYAEEMLFQYAEHGRRNFHASWCDMCTQVMRLVLRSLQLMPSDEGGAPVLASFALAKHWQMLDSPNAVEEVFSLGLSLLDFLHYHEPLELAAVSAHVLEVKRSLSWALAQGPLTTGALWGLWLALRLETRQQLEALAGPGADEDLSAQEESAEAEEDVITCWLAPDEAHGGREALFKVHNGVQTKLTARSDVLKPQHVQILEAVLPEEHQNYDWDLLYSLKKHGSSLSTVFTNCRGSKYSLLAVQDTEGTLFGAFASDEWRSNGDRYYGSGECFLFTFKGGEFAKYSWTRKNSYFMLSSPKGIALGGGGHFALYLDADLLRGSSGQCSTFGSSCLASSTVFECVTVEIWGFGIPGQFGSPERKASRADRDRSQSLAETIQELDLSAGERPL
jgi:hypothetical protein